jgi:hypothetical protein
MLVQRLFDVGSFLIHCRFPCGSWLVRGVFAGDPLLLRMLFLYLCN